MSVCRTSFSQMKRAEALGHVARLLVRLRAFSSSCQLQICSIFCSPPASLPPAHLSIPSDRENEITIAFAVYSSIPS